MEKVVEQGILYDFYGELLTGHQRRIYADAVYNDLSLSEIAEENGISRQGAHDLLKRCDRILAGYESKLHLVEKFTHIRRKAEEIERLSAADAAVGAGMEPGTAGGEERPDGREQTYGAREALERTGRLAREILEEL